MIAIDPLPEEKAREVVHQIVDGVQHLHSLNIVHLDLKVRQPFWGGARGACFDWGGTFELYLHPVCWNSQCGTHLGVSRMI